MKLETRRVRPTEQTNETLQSDEPTEHFKDKAQRSDTGPATSTTHGASTATDLTPVDNQLFQQNLATEEVLVKAIGSAGPMTVSGIGYGNSYPQLPDNAQCNWCFREHKISRNDEGWKQAWK